MNRRRILLLPFLFLSFATIGQISFSYDINENAKKAKVELRPKYLSYLSENYENADRKDYFYDDDKLQFEWAIKHKSLPLEIWYHINPNFLAITSHRIEVLKTELGGTIRSGVKEINEDWIKSLRCSSGHYAWLGSLNTTLSSKNSAFVCSYFKEGCGLVEMFFLYDATDQKLILPEINILALSVCYPPKPKEHMEAGVGAYLGYDSELGLYYFKALLKDGAAHSAGCIAGDYIYKIDGRENLEYEEMRSIVQMCRGEDGSYVEITTGRYGLYFKRKIKRKIHDPNTMSSITADSKETKAKRVSILSIGLLFDHPRDSQEDYIKEDVEGNKYWRSELYFYDHQGTVIEKVDGSFELVFKLTPDRSFRSPLDIYTENSKYLIDALDYFCSIAEEVDESTENKSVRIHHCSAGILEYAEISLNSKSREKHVVLRYVYSGD